MAQSIESLVKNISIKFAEELIGALRAMSLEEILAAKGGNAKASTRSPAAVPVSRVSRAPSAVAYKAPSKAAAPAPKAKTTKGGKLARRSPAAIEKMTGQIIALIKASKSGLRAEEIRAKLGISKPELASPIEGALKAKKITKKGERRATTYFAR